jgi:hypothetical protein
MMLILSGFLITGCNSSSNDALLLLEAESGSVNPGTCTEDGPKVTSSNPAEGDNPVPINTLITVNFSEVMNPTSIESPDSGNPLVTFTLKNSGGVFVAGTVIMNSAHTIANFTPDDPLEINTEYTATITNVAVSAGGTSLSCTYRWSFTTGTATDTTAPTIALTGPVNGASDVILSKSVQTTFSKAMNPLTIDDVSFTLKDGATPVPGTVTYIGLVATFKPTSPLTADTINTAEITKRAKDLAGNAYAGGGATNPWEFTTVDTADVGEGPLPVDLGTAGDFVILAKSGISTTGTTAIGGDIGVSPIKAVGLTGFSQTMDASGEFSTSDYVTAPGKLYASDYAVPTPAKMTAAISDMETAYTDAAGRTLPAPTIDLGAGDISNLTLTPGLYKWGTGVSMDNRGVTLSGGANDVWILQISGNLTVASGAIVILGGSAQAKNIFWQVAGQATLGTTSQFKGIILCQTLIAIQNGASFTGRALAQTAVTLNANAITAP